MGYHSACNKSDCACLVVLQRAIRASLVAMRELAWDDHNACIQPGLEAMAAAGAFEAVAGVDACVCVCVTAGVAGMCDDALSCSTCAA